MTTIDPTLRVEVLDPIELAREAVRLRRGTVTLRIGFAPLMRSWRALLFDVLWLVAVRAGCRRTYWIGTDVVTARATADSSGLRRAIRDRIVGRSACGAPWFVDELGAIGVRATYARFPFESGDVGFRPWPDAFTVSTYVPKLKPDFYGAAVLPAIADLTPQVSYHVYGGGYVEPRDNIVQHGHVDDFADRLAASVVHLRLTEHDAIAGTVRQALAMGRYVVFGYDLPGVTVADVRDAPAIASIVLAELDRFRQDALPPNHAGMAYISGIAADEDARALVDWLVGPAGDTERATDPAARPN